MRFRRFRGARLNEADGAEEPLEHGPGAQAGSEEPSPGSPALVAAPVGPVVVPRWIQLVLLPIGLLALWALARGAGTVLLILLAAATIALTLNPLVRRLERG